MFTTQYTVIQNKVAEPGLLKTCTSHSRLKETLTKSKLPMKLFCAHLSQTIPVFIRNIQTTGPLPFPNKVALNKDQGTSVISAFKETKGQRYKRGRQTPLASTSPNLQHSALSKISYDGFGASRNLQYMLRRTFCVHVLSTALGLAIRTYLAFPESES